MNDNKIKIEKTKQFSLMREFKVHIKFPESPPPAYVRIARIDLQQSSKEMEYTTSISPSLLSSALSVELLSL